MHSPFNRAAGSPAPRGTRARIIGVIPATVVPPRRLRYGSNSCLKTRRFSKRFSCAREHALSATNDKFTVERNRAQRDRRAALVRGVDGIRQARFAQAENGGGLLALSVREVAAAVARAPRTTKGQPVAAPHVACGQRVSRTRREAT